MPWIALRYAPIEGGMAYFLFIDESGHDERASPSAVLAGICIQDVEVWPMIGDIIDAEYKYFGCRYGRVKEEFKGRKFLKRKVYRQAGREAAIDPEERRSLALACITDGAGAQPRQVTALSQAKLAFVDEVLDVIARKHRCRAFASIVKSGAPRPENEFLRKDYAFLFERFFYFVQDQGPDYQGVVVFDELEKSQSKILLDQMEEYFTKFSKGRERAQQIIPQPFFVHSDLTTLIQVADLIAYIIAWGYEIPNSFVTITREEMRGLGNKVTAIRGDARRRVMGKASFTIWGFAPIDDLRGAREMLP
jgi:hypothetical protein